MTLLDLYKPIRKNSYPIISVAVVGSLAYFWILKDFTTVGLILVAAISAFLLLIWLWLRPGQFDLEARTVFDTIGRGRPTFLNIYSNT